MPNLIFQTIIVEVPLEYYALYCDRLSRWNSAEKRTTLGSCSFCKALLLQYLNMPTGKDEMQKSEMK